MTRQAHIVNKPYSIIIVVLFFAFGTLMHGCKFQQEQKTPAKEEQVQSTEKGSRDITNGSALRESDPPDKGSLWRTGEDNKLRIGFNLKDSNYHINHVFGIEQWEKGKRTTHKYQRWNIDCAYPSNSKGNRTECTLERTVFYPWSGNLGGTSIERIFHSAEEGNFVLRGADWGKGRIDFSFTNDDKNIEEVSLRFKIEPDYLVFESLKAVRVSRSPISGEPQPVEDRVAEYTYILNVPVRMEGIYDAGLKEWDNLFNTLGPTDQAAWNEIVNSPLSTNNKPLEKEYELKLKSSLPNFDWDAFNKGTRKLSKEEQAIAGRIMITTLKEKFLKVISESRLSAEAKRKIGDYIKANL